MKAVFLDLDTFSPEIDVAEIKSNVSTLECFNNTQAEQVINRCIDADIIITNKVILNAEVLKQLPQLKLICIAATGTNNVDLSAAHSLNIAVTNVSGYACNSVAQYIFAQLLNYFSQPLHHSENVEKGQWQQSNTFCVHGNGSVELAGKTLGLIGYGSLGQSVAKIAQAFNMNVLVAERLHAKTNRRNRSSFEEVVQQADILSLHCPQTPETENLINKDVFRQMKANAVLVNTARGAIINEQDLLNALKNKQIAYAMLDVLSQEPPPADHPLLQDQPTNLKITAHIAWASIEAQQELLNRLANNIKDFQQGKRTNRVE